MVEPVHVSATRAVYDATAETYAASVGTEINESFEAPLDRAVLAAFTEMTAAAGTGGRVADIGCGPGRVAALLARHGLDSIGIDLSPGMIAMARVAHPAIPFAVGQLSALPLGDRAVTAAVYWYSIIHTPADDLDAVFAELRRVLAHGGPVLLAFQAGNGEAVTRNDAYGTGVTLTHHRHAPDDVVRALGDAGIALHAQVVRQPHLGHEATPQALVLGIAPEL